MKGNRLEKAILSYFDGDIDEAECHQLQNSLRIDPEARALYREHASLQQAFTFRYSRPEQENKKRPQLGDIRLAQQKRRTFHITLAAAAAILLACTITLSLLLIPDPSIATLDSSHGTQYQVRNKDQSSDNQKLTPGSTIELTQGSLELKLNNDVRAIILAPASFKLESKQRLKLNRGTAWFQVGQKGHGFQVATRNMIITDLGTEFGIICPSKQNHEIHVTSGKVELSPLNNELKKETLTTSQSRACSASGEITKIDPRPNAFLKQLPKNTSGNLIINGNFEAGNPPADMNWGEPANPATLPGWIYSPNITVAAYSKNGRPGYGNGQINIFSSTTDTQLGFSIEEQGQPAPTDATIRQTFPTTPGSTYNVSFEFGATSLQQNPSELTATVFDGPDTQSATGSTLAQHVERRAPNQGNGYNPTTRFTFTATSSLATLVFTETSSNSSANALALDNVKVTTSDPK